MDGATTDCGAFDETVVVLSHFKDLRDPRQQGKVAYPLDEVLLLCLLGVLAGAEAFTEIALFGVKKLAFLRRFRPFKDGTPDHGHLSDILAVLDADQFQRCFVAWVAALTGIPAGVIAIDGKTVRRSKSAGKAAIHMVSAFAARQRLVLGQVKVSEKSNEILAIPKLLEMLAIEGAIITIDAMGCQRDIAQKVLDNKADYVRASARSPMEKPGKTPCVSPRLPTGRRLPASSTASQQHQGLILIPGKVQPSAGDQPLASPILP